MKINQSEDDIVLRFKNNIFFNFLQCSHKDSVFRISETTFLTHSEFINSCYIIWCAWQILSLTPAKAQRPTTTPYPWFFLLLFFEEIPRRAIYSSPDKEHKNRSFFLPVMLLKLQCLLCFCVNKKYLIWFDNS